MRVRFGDFELDAEARHLTGPEGEVNLTPKELALLVLLLKRRPRAVSKDEIRDTLWPDTLASESNLTSVVTSLRAALGDEARSPKFIRTAYGFGYAFRASVEEVGRDTTTAATVATGPHVLVEGRPVTLLPGGNVVGRDEKARIRLDSSLVSRRHARIHLSGSSAVLEDLGSKNGTYVQGARLTSPVPLKDGDVVQIGGFRMEYRSAPAGETTRTDLET